MKTKLLLLFVAFALMHNNSYAQKELWGTLSGFAAPSKGTQNGAIFKTDSTGNNISIDYSFATSGGMYPEQTKLCEANNGKLYGMTYAGGYATNGVIFEFDPVTEEYKVTFEFDSNQGVNPTGSLVKAANGLLYGLTSYGGYNNMGVLFAYNPVTNTVTKKFDFGGNYGTNPNGSLTIGNNGLLYGMTSNGGTYSYGVLFEFDPSSGVMHKKVDFTSTNGANPTGDLTLAVNGKMYGLTQGGGDYNFGTLFEYVVGADSVIKRINFLDALNGSYPKGSLLSTSTGKLYGMTLSGGIHNAGVVFEYVISGDSTITRFSLDSTLTGYNPQGSLMEDSSHRIYGMTPYGGANSTGTLFEFLPGSDTCIVKASFDISNQGGVNPKGTLMQASNNKIYGLTYSGGGLATGGSLFEYDTATYTIVKKVNLSSNEGVDPEAGLIKALNGKLYGTTKLGGKFNSGILYEYDPAQHLFKKLYDFDLTNDGGQPLSELLEGNNGLLYGTTTAGGAFSGGTLFKFNIGNLTFTTIHSFDTLTGFTPTGSLIQIGDTLYGMATNGGFYNSGVIYKCDTLGNYSVKHDFTGSGGRNPEGKLLKASNGKLYGLTAGGGTYEYGTLFEYNLATDSCYVRVNMQYNCSSPYGSLIQAANDTLYGMSNMGGQGFGTLFSYNIDSMTVSIKKQFNWSMNGAYPTGDLMIGSNGKLYGTTTQGGYNNRGTLFEYDIIADSLVATSSFYSVSGPSRGSLIEVGCYPSFNTAYATICKGETYTFGTQSLTTSGTYNEIFISTTGCDSTVTLHLTVSCPSGNEYWSMTPFGGNSNEGAIYKVNEKGENYSLEYSFSTLSEGVEPYGGLVQAANGNFYGMTSAGGANSVGVIFEYNPSLKTYNKKIDFDGATKGAVPSSDLIKLPNGLLYGMTESGGVYNAGVLFKYNPDSNIFIKVIDFDTLSLGAKPSGALLLANNGLLYGTTAIGGTSGMGVLFEFNPANNTFTKKIDFNISTNGASPTGLMQANNGLLYGLTSNGGANGAGTLYEYNPSNNNLATKSIFGYQYGSNPQGKVVQASNGQLYGVMQNQGIHNSGLIFKYNFYYNNIVVDTSAFFDSIPKGRNPNFGLTLSPSGNLLGTTTYGGLYDKGVVFEYNNVSISKKLDFDGSNGANPYYSSFMLASKYPVYDTVNQAICAGDTLIHGSNTITAAGLYAATYKTASGLDSTVVLNITVNPVYNVPVFQTICSGDTYVFNGNPLTVAGTYIDTLPSINACDSIITLTLTVNPVYNDSIPVSICQGQTYILGSQILDTTGIYTEVFTSVTGCDSIVKVNLTVNPVYNVLDTATICQGGNYLFFGNPLTVAGNYTDTVPAVTGCDSIVTLTLNVNPVYSDTIAQSICSGDTYILGSQTLSASGQYTEVFTSATGCDSTVVLNLTVVPFLNEYITAAICDGSSYIFGSNTLITAGIYTDTLISSFGCDSIVELTLSVNPVYHDSITQTICQGSSYFFAGNNLTAAGVYNDSLLTVTGCDSITTLTLYVNPVYNDSISQTICQGSSYLFAGNNLTVAGVYNDSLLTVSGCDSVTTLTLYVNPVYNNSITQTICQGDSYFFGGNNLTAGGVYNDSLLTVTGCDSITTLTLYVNPVYNDSISQTICQGSSYLFAGNNLTVAGVYNDSLLTVSGCDSVTTLTLYVNPAYNDSITQTICQGGSYFFGGNSLTTAGIYTDSLLSIAGCDSITTLTLNVNPAYNEIATIDICEGNSYNFGGNILTSAGIYYDTLPSATGCDSIVTLTLNVNPVYNDTLSASICEGDTYILGTQSLTKAGTYTEVFPLQSGCDSTVTVILGIDSLPAKPSVPVGDIEVNYTILSSTYTINDAANATSYGWSLLPVGAGIISGTGTSATVDWSPSFDGAATVVAWGINSCGNGAYSDALNVTITNHPVAAFDYIVTGDTVTFINKSTGIYTDAFWDFGDGTFSTNFNDQHQYLTDGYYVVTLTVYDSGSDYLNSYSQQILIDSHGAAVCNADFIYTTDQKTITFQNKSTGGATDFFWDFGDGKYSYDEDPVNIYDGPGYYTVTFSVYNSSNQCFDNTSAVVYVEELGVAACKAEFSYYPVDKTVYFTSTAVGDYSQHFWDFGNGFNSNEVNPVYTFDKPGYYEVAYSVIDTLNGCFDSETKTIFVPGTDIGGGSTNVKADFSYLPEKGTFKVLFADKSMGSVTNWYWDFGDNTPAGTLQNPEYVYTTNDYYRVCLTAGNSSSQSTKCDFIAVGDVSLSSTAYYTYFADSVTATARFKNQSLGDIKSYLWDFGDGNSSVQKNPSHTYADTGYYAVCLTTVSGSGISKTYCNEVRIGNTISNPCLFSCVWPGDANSDLEANHYDIMTLGLNYGMQGPKREDASMNWYGQSAQNWSTYQLDGTNNKHGDCNGDGVINYDDLQAIELNFASSHYWQPDVKSAEWQIGCQWEPEGNKAAGSRRQAKAILISEFKGKAGSMYGLGYEVEVVGGEKIVWNSIKVSFDNSWIGVDGKNMLTITQMDSINHMIYIGMARTDQTDTLGSGEIAMFDFEFKPGFDAKGVSFNVTTNGGIVSTGESTGIGGSISLDLATPQVLCNGGTTLLDAGAGFDTYTWSTGATDTSRIEVDTPGVYYVTVSNSQGATASDSIVVEPHDLPVVSLGNDVTQNDSLLLDAGSGNYSYLWSTGENTQTINVKETGEYWVQVMNEFGCTATDTIQVTIITGINAQTDKNITVFPNPNNGKFWLVYEFNLTTSTVVEIVNTNGKTVWRREVKDYPGRNYPIGADKLEKGVYLLKVLDNSRMVTKRFVVL